MFFIYSDVQYFMHPGTIFFFNLVQFFILCASAQFYALWYDYYFMRVSAILRTLVRLLFYARQRNFMQGNFRHWQASTQIGVVLK